MKNKKIFILSLIVAFGVCAISTFLYINNKNQEEYKIAEIKIGSIYDTTEETATVFSKRVTGFYSDMSQTVETLNVSIGDKVKKGDILLSYKNNTDLEIERANKQIESVTAIYNETTKGADFQDISNIKLNIGTIENNLDLARSNLEKIKILYDNDAVSKIEYDEANNKVMTLENQLEEANNNYSLLTKGVSSNVKKQYEAQIEEIMIQIKLLEKSKEQSIIKAEFDGVVTELNVSQGGMTCPGVIVTEIQDEYNIGVFAELLADEFVKLSDNMPVTIKNNNLGLNIDNLKINRIYPKAISKISDLGVEQKLIRIECDIPKGGYTLKIGTDLDMIITIETKDDALLVEKDAVYKSEGKEYVTILVDGKTEEVQITTGIKGDKYVEILSGIDENSHVILQ